MGTHTTLRENAMLAGDVAKHLGIGVQTLHYYEREDLIPAPERSQSGYRLYSKELVDRITFVRKAQALGLPLAEIRDVLRLADKGACPCGHVQRALAQKLHEVDSRLRELESFRDDLASLVGQAPELSAGNPSARVCAIVEHAPASATAAMRVGTPLARRRRDKA